MGWIQDPGQPQGTRVGRILSQPLAARQRRPQHSRRQLHRRLLVGGIRQGGPRYLGDAADRLPLLEPGLPPYEPRGCQRGITASWYDYSPLRVKYPYIRGPLLDLWREAKKAECRPHRGLGGSSWRTTTKRARYQRARGRGGFRRAIVGRSPGDRRRLKSVHGAEVGTGSRRSASAPSPPCPTCRMRRVPAFCSSSVALT